ncbi:hypothetical protein KP803_10835 [Vibrio sp. ZSDE26]|uniref:Sugar ABC transporter ATPase n=1 Tax=Vibrio amylolyticus TaxID=2847292 RepID=A0A9X2BLC2_9VIBR|nr:ABC transporter substrate binding protein [Vibrio amylolyticus]MCK6263768.1 hypothetical protein [Vibrio amylolyticus]
MKTLMIVLLTCFCLPALAGKILLIESYHSEFPWDKEYIQGIESQIDASHQFDTFQMNTKRIPQEQFEPMAEKAWSYYQQVKPDIVILGDDNALKYMLPKLYDEPISIIFLGINSNPRWILSKYKGQAQITGILERPLLLKNIKDIADLMSLKQGKVLVLFDSGTTSEIANSFISRKFNAAKTHLNINIDSHNIGTINEWKSTVSDAKNQGYDAIMIGLYHTLIDDNNNNVDANSVLSWTNQHSPLPLFGFWDFSVGKGKTIGGVVLFGESQGAAAGVVARQILKGKPVSSIPIATGKKGKAIYSEHEAARWNLTPPAHWAGTD